MSFGNHALGCDTAVILSAGELPDSVRAAFGRTSPAMLPISGRPIIHWSISYLREQGIKRIIVALRGGELRVQQFVANCFGKSIELFFVEIGEDRGPGFSLAACLDKCSAGEPVLVVLGDTLFSFPTTGLPDAGESFVLTHPAPDSARWCLAKADAAGVITELIDKPIQNEKQWPALIGVYFLASPSRALDALNHEISSHNDPIQLSHALAPYVKRNELKSVSAGEWFDCGHADFFNQSRRRLLKSRDFNSLQLDELRGTITKRSTHTEKFLGEINYYRLLPPNLAAFFPRLLDFDINPGKAFLTLEYYGYPTLSELWAFEDFGADFWGGVFQLLSRVLECFREYRLTLSDATVFRFYWGKTCDRIESFGKQSAQFTELVHAPSFTLNGRELPGWPELRERVETAVRDLSAKSVGAIIHGDLCFPNVLFDPVAHIFKFIDPRGNFGEAGLFGDQRYDLAKLLHSLDGGYDFLIHDMFTVHAEGTNIELHQFFPVQRDSVLQEFVKIFGKSHDIRELRLIEGLLFVSMCPLHSDAPARQIAMFAIGLRLLAEALDAPHGGLSPIRNLIHENLH